MSTPNFYAKNALHNNLFFYANSMDTSKLQASVLTLRQNANGDIRLTNGMNFNLRGNDCEFPFYKCDCKLGWRCCYNDQECECISGEPFCHNPSPISKISRQADEKNISKYL